MASIENFPQTAQIEIKQLFVANGTISL